MFKVKNKRVKALIMPFNNNIQVKLLKNLKTNTYEVIIERKYVILNRQKCNTINKATMYFKMFINKTKRSNIN